LWEIFLFLLHIYIYTRCNVKAKTTLDVLYFELFINVFVFA